MLWSKEVPGGNVSGWNVRVCGCTPSIVMCRGVLTCTPVKIQCFEDGVFVGRLVEDDVAHFAQEGEVDDAGGVFLVVCHQFVEAVVLFAVEGESAVVFFDEADGLLHFVPGEAGFQVRQVELADESPSHCVAVQHGTVFCQGKTFEGMPDGVPQVEGFADAVFVGVLLYECSLSPVRSVPPVA